MAIAVRPSSAAARLLLGLVVAALVGGGTAQPSVAQRTHTFQSYYTSTAAVRDLIPVYVSTAKVMQGTYAQDNIVSLGNGAPLDCGPGNTDGTTDCDLVEVWRSPRRQQNYESIPIGSGMNMPFAFKKQNNLLRLMVNLQNLGDVYKPLQLQRRQLAWGSSKNYSAKALAKYAHKDDNVMDPSMGVYYDPWLPVRAVAACCPPPWPWLPAFLGHGPTVLCFGAALFPDIPFHRPLLAS